MLAPLHRSLGRALLGLLTIGLLSACKDLPTSPHPLQLRADGENWVALEPPRQLPDVATWLAHADRSGAERRATLERIRSAQRKADRARLAGDLEQARALRRLAVRSAVLALPEVPPRVIRQGLGAVDLWLDRVEQGVRLEETPALALAVDSVRRARAEADAALAAGDSQRAALSLADAAEQIRQWSPTEVALRVLDRAARRLEGPADAPAELVRARHLVQSARQELITGEPLRALQRALYALQLVSGGQLREDLHEEPRDCGAVLC